MRHVGKWLMGALLVMGGIVQAGGVVCALESKIRMVMEANDEGDKQAVIVRARETLDAAIQIERDNLIEKEFPSLGADRVAAAYEKVVGIALLGHEISDAVAVDKPVDAEVQCLWELFVSLKSILLNS